LEVIEMKTKSAFPLFLLAILAGPAMAETATDAQLSDGCQLVGPLRNATEDCKAIRTAFRTEVNDCLNMLHTEAKARAGKANTNNSHASRARFLTCNAAARVKLGQIGQ